MLVFYIFGRIFMVETRANHLAKTVAQNWMVLGLPFEERRTDHCYDKTDLQ